jgi:hypothetical protein
MERMRAEGVPIITDPGEGLALASPLQMILAAAAAGRITMEEYQQRCRVLANDLDARRSWIRANGLDQ